MLYSQSQQWVAKKSEEYDTAPRNCSQHERSKAQAVTLSIDKVVDKHLFDGNNVIRRKVHTYDWSCQWLPALL